MFTDTRNLHLFTMFIESRNLHIEVTKNAVCDASIALWPKNDLTFWGNFFCKFGQGEIEFCFSSMHDKRAYHAWIYMVLF